ncbi:MAG TPA: ribonuclease P protein component, partial [Caulobacter sp.]
RAKRRLREAARLLLPLHGRPMYDYVFIARGGTRTREWGRLLDDVKTALISLAAEHDRAEARARLAQSVDLPKDPSSDALPATPGAPDSSVSG